MRPQLPALIRSLGYCCVWIFFRQFGRTGKIADRLGLSPRTVREWRSRHTAGEFRCEKCQGCLKDRLP